MVVAVFQIPIFDVTSGFKEIVIALIWGICGVNIASKASSFFSPNNSNPNNPNNSNPSNSNNFNNDSNNVNDNSLFDINFNSTDNYNASHDRDSV